MTTKADRSDISRALDHIEWLRRELMAAREEVEHLRDQPEVSGVTQYKVSAQDLLDHHGTVTIWCGEDMGEVAQARDEYRTALEDIATSAADKETLKGVAREVLTRWREKVGE